MNRAATTPPSRTLGRKTLVRNRFTIDTDIVFHGSPARDTPRGWPRPARSPPPPRQHAAAGGDTDRWVEEQFDLGRYDDQDDVKETDILSDDDEYCESLRGPSAEPGLEAPWGPCPWRRGGRTKGAGPRDTAMATPSSCPTCGSSAPWKGRWWRTGRSFGCGGTILWSPVAKTSSETRGGCREADGHRAPRLTNLLTSFTRERLASRHGTSRPPHPRPQISHDALAIAFLSEAKDALEQNALCSARTEHGETQSSSTVNHYIISIHLEQYKPPAPLSIPSPPSPHLLMHQYEALKE
ncbi:hypothetical protein ANANG_G00164390 [Anguilla anguilla]|uniref:Uncharacterized protein n=1 Tax=Anguilla anguilla TaxID=7936 RepID=A0A9D3RZ73_ANGAN|nr:hypothetical protein ANANG_G00164390 [Anguilla anguilla]